MLGASQRPVAVGTAARGYAARPQCGPGMELPDPVRQRLGDFSRTVFSDSNRTVPEYSEGPGEWPRPSAGGVAHQGPGAATFCPDLKWWFRLQRILRSAGRALEEGPGQGLGLGEGLGRLWPGYPTGLGLIVLQRGRRSANGAAEVVPSFIDK